MATDPDKIHERLAASLDLANKLEAKAKAPPAAPAPAPPRRNKKFSVSLFKTDVQRVEEIRAYAVAQLGVRLSVSEAIKLALRTVPMNTEAFATALDDMRMEDGRKALFGPF